MKQQRQKANSSKVQNLQFFKTNMRYLMENDGWSRFSWIERKCDFIYHHFRELWNPWMTIFPISCNFEWKIGQFFRDFTLTGIGRERDWKVIPLNVGNCFKVWIFREREFTDPLLVWTTGHDFHTAIVIKSTVKRESWFREMQKKCFSIWIFRENGELIVEKSWNRFTGLEYNLRKFNSRNFHTKSKIS